MYVAYDSFNTFDNFIIKNDGTKNKSYLGANATLAVSLANSKSAALSVKKPLYKNLGKSFSLPKFVFLCFKFSPFGSSNLLVALASAIFLMSTLR